MMSYTMSRNEVRVIRQALLDKHEFLNGFDDLDKRTKAYEEKLTIENLLEQEEFKDE